MTNDSRIEREISDRYGPARERRLEPKKRMNLYLDVGSAEPLASRQQLSATVRALLEANRGTTAGSLMEAQVRLDRAGRDLADAEARLADATSDLRGEVLDVAGIPVAERDLSETVHSVRSGLEAEALEALGASGTEFVARAFCAAAVLEFVAVHAPVVVVPNPDKPELRLDLTEGNGPPSERDATAIRHRRDLLCAFASLCVERARLVAAERHRVATHQDRLADIGRKWEAQALAAIAGMADRLAKYREAGGNALEEWAGGSTVPFLQATGIKLGADELLAVLLAYIEGGPPDALERLRSYL